MAQISASAAAAGNSRIFLNDAAGACYTSTLLEFAFTFSCSFSLWRRAQGLCRHGNYRSPAAYAYNERDGWPLISPSIARAPRKSSRSYRSRKESNPQ